MTQLQKVVNIKITQRDKTKNDQITYAQADFDYCTHEDFKSNNYTGFDNKYEKLEAVGKEYKS